MPRVNQSMESLLVPAIPPSYQKRCGMGKSASVNPLVVSVPSWFLRLRFQFSVYSILNSHFSIYYNDSTMVLLHCRVPLLFIWLWFRSTLIYINVYALDHWNICNALYVYSCVGSDSRNLVLHYMRNARLGVWFSELYIRLYLSAWAILRIL